MEHNALRLRALDVDTQAILFNMTSEYGLDPVIHGEDLIIDLPNDGRFLAELMDNEDTEYTHRVKEGIVLVPAYGRDYQTAGEVKRAWESGADFRIMSGPYCSNSDEVELRERFGATIKVVYNDRQFTCVV